MTQGWAFQIKVRGVAPLQLVYVMEPDESFAEMIAIQAVDGAIVGRERMDDRLVETLGMRHGDARIA
jgi:hypothetical protein